MGNKQTAVSRLLNISLRCENITFIIIIIINPSQIRCRSTLHWHDNK